jgi:hypothetical protein
MLMYFYYYFEHNQVNMNDKMNVHMVNNMVMTRGVPRCPWQGGGAQHTFLKFSTKKRFSRFLKFLRAKNKKISKAGDVTPPAPPTSVRPW